MCCVACILVACDSACFLIGRLKGCQVVPPRETALNLIRYWHVTISFYLALKVLSIFTIVLYNVYSSMFGIVQECGIVCLCRIVSLGFVIVSVPSVVILHMYMETVHCEEQSVLTCTHSLLFVTRRLSFIPTTVFHS